MIPPVQDKTPPPVQDPPIADPDPHHTDFRIIHLWLTVGAAGLILFFVLCYRAFVWLSHLLEAL